MTTRPHDTLGKGLRIGLALIGLCTLRPEPASCEWQTFTTADGLAGRTVLSMLEDRERNLWFGTHSGVSRYDGATWKTFTTADGLANNNVRAILQDRAGNLWFGTYGGGVSRYNGEGWRTFTNADGLASNDVLAILEDRTGALWFGTNGGGVSRYDGTAWRTLTTADGLANNDVSAILEDHAGNLWFAGSGVSRYDGVGWQRFLANNQITSIMEDRAGDLWFGTWGAGVSRYDGTSWRTFTSADGLAGNYVNAMLEDRAGGLWFGAFEGGVSTVGGVSRYDGASWRTFGTADGLAHSSVWALLQDRAGNLWFGTSSGVTRYDGASWRTFTTVDGLANDDIDENAMLEDRTGSLWFGTYGGGVSRYDGETWQTFTTADGLASNVIFGIVEDRAGSLWFGTYDSGISRYDGVSWRTYTVDDGLASNGITQLVQDHVGNLWVATVDGVSRYDGAEWRTFSIADGLADNHVMALLEDHAGNLWFGTYSGVTRYDGASWRTFTMDDGLANNVVRGILEDREGNLWFAAYGAGVSRYNGASWQTFTTADGLADNTVFAMMQDTTGALWFGTSSGVSRYDGASWRTFTAADGLANNNVYAMLEDRKGNLWFGTAGGVTAHDRDRVAPRAVWTARPPRISSSRDIAVAFVAAFDEAGIEFSYGFDRGPWSPWSLLRSWSGENLSDGVHHFAVRARDKSNNVDFEPLEITFEVDATPPTALITAPVFRQAIRDSATISGTADDPRLRDFRVEFRPVGSVAWTSPPLAQSSTPVTGGTLAAWNTRSVPDGEYELRLSVTDTLGLVATALVTVVVDNRFPHSEETVPAIVSAGLGGDLYTTNQELHLYFPPHAFDGDVPVSVVPSASVPDTLPTGAIHVLQGYDVSWGSSPLRKAATLELSMEGLEVPGTVAIYSSSDDGVWRRLGGTRQGGKLSLAIHTDGRYALFAEKAWPAGGKALSGLSLTPRVFSAVGRFANDHVAIGFTLGRSASVTVRIYNRAGRLIREVVSAQTMGPGANLVRWDGQDRRGVPVADGVYLVTVEALGQTRRSTVAVVR